MDWKRIGQFLPRDDIRTHGKWFVLSVVVMFIGRRGPICFLIAAQLAIIGPLVVRAEVTADDAVLYFDFANSLRNQAAGGGTLEASDGLQIDENGYLPMDIPHQTAHTDSQATELLSHALRDTDSLSIGMWILPRRDGEQVIVGRGNVTVGELGERFFRPSDRFINFCLGTDEHGFLMGTIHGNGQMPFPHVTVCRLPIMTWQQLVIVKTADGYHRFYCNGRLVHTDQNAMAAPSRHAWTETDAGLDVPIRLRMPTGGLIGQFWVIGRALSAGAVAADYRAKRARFQPAPQPADADLVEMDMRRLPRPEFDREQVAARLANLLGPMPREIVPLEPQVGPAEDCGSYWRRHVSIQVQPDDRMPAYLLVPKELERPAGAVICFYGTTSGAGKKTTVGLSGRRGDDPPHPNLSFAIDMAQAGFVTLAPDYLRDGERIHPGDRPYDTTRFYKQFPEWSVHGKDAWDTMRAIDFLETLDFVDSERIGMVGHSYGGHGTIFTAAVEPRIVAAVANGPVSAFREHGMHWAVPPGASNSQSLPALRPYLLDPDRPLPVTFADITSLIAPRPLLVGQAVGERRPIEKENYGQVSQLYTEAGAADRVQYVWYAGDHDFPPEMRTAAVAWLRQWLHQP